MKISYFIPVILLLSACAQTPTVAEVRESQSNRSPAAAIRGLMVRCDLGVFKTSSFDFGSRDFSGNAIAQKDQHFGSYFEKFEVALEGFTFSLKKADYADEYSAAIQQGKKFTFTNFQEFPAQLLLTDSESGTHAEINCVKE